MRKLTTSYDGHKKDLLVTPITGVAPGIPQETRLGFSSETLAGAGLQKLLQNFIRFMFTTAGSVLGDERMGSNFLPVVQSAYIQEEFVIPAFSSCMLDFQEYQRSHGLDTIPEDEQLKTAILDQLIWTEEGRLMLMMTVVSVAGEAAQYIVPVRP